MTDVLSQFPPHVLAMVADMPAPRDVLADAPHYDDDAVIHACRLLIAAPSTDEDTRARALDMLTLVEGEARESCAV